MELKVKEPPNGQFHRWPAKCEEKTLSDNQTTAAERWHDLRETAGRHKCDGGRLSTGLGPIFCDGLWLSVVGNWGNWDKGSKLKLKVIKGGGSSSKDQGWVWWGSSLLSLFFEEDVKGVLLLFVDMQKEGNPYLPLWTKICDENCEHYEELRKAFLGMLQNGIEDAGCNFFKWCTDVGSEDSGHYVKSEGKKETLVNNEELETNGKNQRVSFQNGSTAALWP
ncbi:hypothetical protein V8G54_023748 [Vigna mungo]|uniref:Uncharacterized protein n=1 Tax=Vigna mungo TaxID=3915 RepID=A0AAQ3RQM4_VIGMU